LVGNKNHSIGIEDIRSIKLISSKELSKYHTKELKYGNAIILFLGDVEK